MHLTTDSTHGSAVLETCRRRLPKRQPPEEFARRAAYDGRFGLLDAQARKQASKQAVVSFSTRTSPMRPLVLVCAVVFLGATLVAVAWAQPRARASESPVRVSVFTKDRKENGGYLVRVNPTDTWDEFLGLGNARLKIQKVCGAVDEAGQPVQSLADVYDGAEIYFVPCAGYAPSRATTPWSCVAPWLNTHVNTPPCIFPFGGGEGDRKHACRRIP